MKINYSCSHRERSIRGSPLCLITYIQDLALSFSRSGCSERSAACRSCPLGRTIRPFWPRSWGSREYDGPVSSSTLLSWRFRRPRWQSCRLSALGPLLYTFVWVQVAAEAPSGSISRHASECLLADKVGLPVICCPWGCLGEKLTLPQRSESGLALELPNPQSRKAQKPESFGCWGDWRPSRQECKILPHWDPKMKRSPWGLVWRP